MQRNHENLISSEERNPETLIERIHHFSVALLLWQYHINRSFLQKLKMSLGKTLTDREVAMWLSGFHSSTQGEKMEPPENFLDEHSEIFRRWKKNCPLPVAGESPKESPKPAEESPKPAEESPKPAEESPKESPEDIFDPLKCKARAWNDGEGGQCQGDIHEDDFCKRCFNKKMKLAEGCALQFGLMGLPRPTHQMHVPDGKLLRWADIKRVKEEEKKKKEEEKQRKKEEKEKEKMEKEEKKKEREMKKKEKEKEKEEKEKMKLEKQEEKEKKAKEKEEKKKKREEEKKLKEDMPKKIKELKEWLTDHDIDFDPKEHKKVQLVEMYLNFKMNESKGERVIENVEVENPLAESPKAESPKAESPKAESPKAESPKAESPKAGSPKAESPKAESPKAESPKAEEEVENPLAKKIVKGWEKEDDKELEEDTSGDIEILKNDGVELRPFTYEGIEDIYQIDDETNDVYNMDGEIIGEYVDGILDWMQNEVGVSAEARHEFERMKNGNVSEDTEDMTDEE